MDQTQLWLRRGVSKVPGVTEPQRWQQVERRRIGAAVGRREADADVFRPGFRVLDRHVEVAIVIEDPGVEQFVLGKFQAATLVLLDQLLVGKRGLRVFVQPVQVRMGRGRIQVEVIFLHVLAVVPLPAREAEHALLEDRVAFVPERQRKAQPLVVVRDAHDAVLAPAVDPGSGHDHGGNNPTPRRLAL